MYVVIEGNSSVGKTTQIELLEKQFRELDHEVLVVPSRYADDDLSDILLEALDEYVASANPVKSVRTDVMLRSAYLAHVHEVVVEPALRAGVTVIQETGVDHVIASTGFARGIGPSEVAQIIGWAQRGMHAQLTVLLDGLPDVHHADMVSGEEDAHLVDMRNRFKLLAGWQKENHVVITADRSIEIIHHDIMTEVMDAMKKAGEVFKEDPLEKMLRG